MTHRIVTDLEARLPDLARDIIEKSTRLPEDHKIRFYNAPDAYEQHHPKWHQWGIITHSRKFREMYEGEGRELLQDWELDSKVDRYLSEEIDGMPKADLLKIAMPLHDLGKFDKVLDGDTYDYKGHEKISEHEVLHGEARGLLESHGLTTNQIEYVARCVAKHFELGLMRYDAERTDLGYTFAYTKSEQFRKDVAERTPQFSGLDVEVGLLFLADSLAKTEVRSLDSLAERGLVRLTDAVKQHPIQIEFTKQYLKIVLM